MEILGIDIGGSGIKAAIVNIEEGRIVSERFRLPTPKPSKPHAVADVVCKMIEHFDYSGPVGVSFPTVVKNGKAIFSSNLHKDWKNLNIDELFKEHCGHDFYVINDADAAGIAEMVYGAGRGKDGLVITITVGTGIGSGVFFNGQMLSNFELGRLYWKSGELVELYAADSARKREDLSYKVWGKRLNKFLKYIEDTLHPDLFILGGGVSKKMDRFEDAINIKTPLVPAIKLNNAGIIGAAEHVKEQLDLVHNSN